MRSRARRKWRYQPAWILYVPNSFQGTYGGRQGSITAKIIIRLLNVSLVPALERLCDLAALTQSGLGIPIFLPTDWEHDVACFACSHYDAKLVACCREVIAGLVTKRNLPSPALACARYVWIAVCRAETYHLSPHNVAWPEAFVDLDFVLLCCSDVLRPDDTLPLGLQHRLAHDENGNGSLAGLNACHPTQDNVSYLGQDLALLRDAGSRDRYRGQRRWCLKSLDLCEPLGGAECLLGLLNSHCAKQRSIEVRILDVCTGTSGVLIRRAQELTRNRYRLRHVVLWSFGDVCDGGMNMRRWTGTFWRAAARECKYPGTEFSA